MCCCFGPRATLILISCWAICQSVVYIGLSVMAILLKKCQITMDGSQFNYFMYITYFRDAACGPINWSLLGVPTPPSEPIMDAVTSVVSRTNDLAYTYLILHCIWIVASISLIVSTFTPCMSQLCLKVFSFPWVIICCAVLALEGVATIIFIIDITKTTTLEGYLEFIGIANVNDILPHINSFPEYLLPIPAVVMMLVSNGGVVLWSINLACLIYVIVSVKKLVRNELSKQPPNRAIRPDFGYEREMNVPEQRMPNSQLSDGQMTELSRYNDASVQNQYQYDNDGFSPEPIIQKYPPQNNNYIFVSEKRYMEPLKGATRSDDGNSSRLSNARSLDSVDDVSRTSSNLGMRSQSSSIDQALENEPPSVERISYLSNESMLSENTRRMMNNRASASPQPILVKPSLIKQQQQQLQQQQQFRDENMTRANYHTPPDELRSQLPWSYFQDRDEISRPLKQKFDDEVLPPVPVPDYTLHFPKKDRPPTRPKPTTNRNSNNHDPYEGNEKWSGPEYTY